MKLENLVHGTDITLTEELKDVEVNGITHNSEKVKQGDAFICIKGFNTDGHLYAKDAIRRGASLVISEKELPLSGVPLLLTRDTRRTLSKISANFYGGNSESFRIFGITGTNGKTTVSYMIKNILEAGGIPCGILGTIGYQVKNKKYEPVNTTPESSTLQRLFAEMREQDIKDCVMEVSSHALALGRVDDIQFKYTIFTNLTPDHLDFHKDMENYYQAKKKLFLLGESTCIINWDDPYGERLYNELKVDNKKVLAYSLLQKNADYFAEIVDYNEKSTTIEVYNNNRAQGIIKLNARGKFNIYNSLAAFATIKETGLLFETIKLGLERLKGVPGRFELVENSKNYLVIVDYAHTPDALENVLKTIHADGVKGRLISVFGCGGDRDKGKRPLMGEVAGKYSDYCIITSDNPRTENQQDILTDIKKGISKTDCDYITIADRYEAIKKAVSIYEEGDIILIAGKGHETYQIIGNQKKHFDDREVVVNIIENDG
ncbi:MAG: UDP-N-acetylmuramoyl-L-alanyl-D-glutamate--2,6-diaminopimelate ligase [Anaerovoracaceae bacterium]